jgi:hypothetical protein
MGGKARQAERNHNRNDPAGQRSELSSRTKLIAFHVVEIRHCLFRQS